jgi:hypothetical protein
MRHILSGVKPIRYGHLVGLLLLAMTPIAFAQENLIADNLSATDNEDLASSFDTAADQTPKAICCPSYCRPRWTASADCIILDRVGSVSYTLVQTVPHDQPYTNPGTEVLNADDLHEGFAAGPKLGLIRHGDNGYDLELSYFQIDGWNDYQSIGPTPDYWLKMTAPGNFIQTQDHKYTQMMAWDYSSRLYNAEVNVRRSLNDRLTLLIGFRWTNLSEGLQGTLPELPGTWPDRKNPFWDTRVRNNLYGLQIGADGKLLEYGRFSLNGLIKTGIFGNDVVETTGVSVYRTIYRESDTTGHVAFLGETGLQCKYQVNRKLCFKLGYEAMWLQGVALAPGQISETYCYCAGQTSTYIQAMGVNCKSGVFYHGATAGLEYSF